MLSEADLVRARVRLCQLHAMGLCSRSVLCLLCSAFADQRLGTARAALKLSASPAAPHPCPTGVRSALRSWALGDAITAQTHQRYRL